MRTERWKYIRYPDTQPIIEELFDLDGDPGELKSLAHEPAQREILAQLRARCDELRAAAK